MSKACQPIPQLVDSLLKGTSPMLTTLARDRGERREDLVKVQGATCPWRATTRILLLPTPHRLLLSPLHHLVEGTLAEGVGAFWGRFFRRQHREGLLRRVQYRCR
jgi:hypothetical protein